MNEPTQSGEQQMQETPKVSVIEAVQTPLGFFTLTILVVEVVILAVARVATLTPNARAITIVGSLVLLFISVLVVALIAFFRPYALSGKPAPSEVLPCTEMISRLEKLIKNTEDLSISAKEIAQVLDTLFPRGQPTEIEPAELKIVLGLVRDHVHFSSNVMNESKELADFVHLRCITQDN